MNNRKQTLISKIQNLINQQPTNIEVFRQTIETMHLPKEKQLFVWNDQTLKRPECSRIKAGMRIFVVRGTRPNSYLYA